MDGGFRLEGSSAQYRTDLISPTSRKIGDPSDSEISETPGQTRNSRAGVLGTLLVPIGWHRTPRQIHRRTPPDPGGQLGSHPGCIPAGGDRAGSDSGSKSARPSPSTKCRCPRERPVSRIHHRGLPASVPTCEDLEARQRVHGDTVTELNRLQPPQHHHSRSRS
ncbi:unnamed protein product [Phytophthora fragariaefolia]|uniref:Unnamed protein product n=1 Tax=Phytophthora fragariaefolia TaxID=1490495 RepID=A0A9W7CTN6_9STRA|nr:unnamed protein product [Phytophthora fragariaefolia]